MDSGDGQGLSTGFEFFNIIFKSTLKKEKLKLPKRVARLYGGTLPKSILLKPPYGSEWKIGLKKSDGKVWLNQDWPKFAKHYSLGVGHLLIFRHEGNSQFQLSICDSSTCQIDYPSITAHSDESEVKGNPKVPNKEETKDDDDDDSVQILGSSSPCPNTAEESLPPISPPRKRMRTRASAQLLKRVRGDNYCLHLQSEAVGIKSQHPREKVDAKKGKVTAARQRTRGVITDSKAFEAASKFSSGKPFFKSRVTNFYKVCLPANFVKKYLEPKSQIVRLEIGNNRWLVHFSSYKSGYYLCKGYHKFLQENSLHSGDICIFELIERNYHRRVVMKRLPTSFVKGHIEQKPQIIRLEVGNRSWQVQFLDCNTGHFLCGGYFKFLRENSLGRGDVCIYELNDKNSRTEIVLKVSIFRCNHRQV